MMPNVFAPGEPGKSPPPAPPDVGELAPDFALPAPMGSDRTLRDLRGQPVVLLFFADHWDPTRGEQIALFNRLVAGLSNGQPNLVELEVKDNWGQAQFDHQAIGFPLITDLARDAAIAHRFGVAGREAVFMVDASGVVRWRHIVSPSAPLTAVAALAALRDLAASSAAPEGSATRQHNGKSKRTASWRATRREFVAAAVAAALALSLPSNADARSAAGSPEPAGPTRLNGSWPSAPPSRGASTMDITLTINGASHRLAIEPRVTLLDALREELGLTGSKKGCDHGQCGACTVLVDGRRVNACLSLAIMQQGKSITTIEGIADGDRLHPVQTAFIEHDAFQCGYCTAGQVVSAVAVLNESWGSADNDVRDAMSGNICRCGAYPNIVAAVQQARRQVGLGITSGGARVEG